jgi:chromosome segregation protein
VKLRSIRSFGFKTFAEPTQLEFDGGVTAIVGPNGSGKSNLVDAFRWVLGETSTKSLRSGRLEDVIFAGNELRKPLGLAEVSILFDNSDGRMPIDFREVELTRRAYRVGESEYFINRTQVRLRDIVDLLMGTGLGPGSYAIVSQGQIDAILTSKPAERRALFEETAGIGKFLARKNESLRRLERTEQNAIRISDLIAELDRRIPELDTQVRRAKRYRRVSARVRDLEILSYLRASATRRAEATALREVLGKNEEQRSVAAAKSAASGAALTALRTELYRCELELEELRSQSQGRRGELASSEAQYAAALARREALERQSTQTSEDAARVGQERAALVEAIADLEERIAPLAREIDTARDRELGAQTALAQTHAQLESVFTQLRDIEVAATHIAARKAERRVQADALRAEAERLDREARAARERAEETEIVAGGAAHRHGERRRQLEILEEAALDARGRAEDAAREAALAQDDVARTLAVVHEQSGEVKAAESRLHTIEELENSLEGHVPGTRAVIEAWQRGELSGIEGIVSNLITTEERYARAMDVAFGARLSNVVTTTSEDAERGVDFLNRKEAGRATFLPLDTLADRKGRQLDPAVGAVAGVLGYAHTLVSTAPRFAGVVSFLVGNVLIVDKLQTGIELVRGRGFRDTIVTLGGEQITGGGAITGGRFARERSILSRRFQAQSLRDALVGMHGRFEEAERGLSAAHRRAEIAIDKRDAAREQQTETESRLVGLRAELGALAGEVERTRAELEAARAAASQLRAAAALSWEREHEYERVEPEAERSDEHRTQLEGELAGVRERIARAEADQVAASDTAADLRERAAALTAERDAAKGRLGMLDQDGERAGVAREEMLAEIASLMQETRTSHAHVEGLRRGITGLDERLESARRQREALVQRQTQLESDLRTAEQEERETAAGGERQRTRLAEIEAELGMLVSQFAQNPATNDECADVTERYKKEPDAIVEELPRLRDELARLQANVNLNADAERDELAERQRFLGAQLEDLSAARETLLESIREIERETQVRFNETFAKVSEAFATMYGRLFAGGQAKMWQTQPENLAETGIEIAVQPPGKKEMPLAALSGGERAMTAAALIFALIATKPAPFYLLDEVDAALDDANIDRFCAMVREFATESQMLIVTHNKKTMEIADRIYGVTTSDSGASAIVSAELAAQAEALLA